MRAAAWFLCPLLSLCRVVLWPSSLEQRPIWNVPHSHRRRACTASSGQQHLPASARPAPSLPRAQPEAFPRDSSAYPADLSSSLPLSKKRKQKAALSCEGPAHFWEQRVVVVVEQLWTSGLPVGPSGVGRGAAWFSWARLENPERSNSPSHPTTTTPTSAGPSIPSTLQTLPHHAAAMCAYR